MEGDVSTLEKVARIAISQWPHSTHANHVIMPILSNPDNVFKYQI
jgi:phosphotransacetylase